jgi:two-component system, OmpR family, response regulator QseB
MRVLIVEDDAAIVSGLAAVLRSEGYAVDVCDNLAHAWTALSVEAFDLVLLDLGLADGDGIHLLRRLRQPRVPADALPKADLPVLIMTARDALTDRVAGLDDGADDYLVKPVQPEELLARMRLALRRSAGRATPCICYGELQIDPAARTLTRRGKPIVLRAKEWAVLLTLLQARGHVLGRSRLEEALYGFDEGLDSNALEVHIHHLRRKVGEGVIKTVRGVGYFVPRDPEVL